MVNAAFKVCQAAQFLQQGISAIFRFVQMVWAWSITQIRQVAHSPWQGWPFWKQVLMVVVLAAVVFALFKVAKEFWEAGERVLAAFATLLGVFVRTLPQVVVAGLIAMGGVWLINNVDRAGVSPRHSAPGRTEATPEQGCAVARTRSGARRHLTMGRRARRPDSRLSRRCPG